jgi:hypothetical protein
MKECVDITWTTNCVWFVSVWLYNGEYTSTVDS